MWKPGNTSDKPQPVPVPDASANTAPARPGLMNAVNPLNAQPPQAIIGKSIVIKGNLTGAESLFLEGRIEGSVDLTGHYLHVGQNASVDSNITARELVVRGTVTGAVTLEDRLDIRTGGSLLGDVTARRVSIEDGAYFKGSIDMRREQKEKVQALTPKPDHPVTATLPSQPAAMTAAAGK